MSEVMSAVSGVKKGWCYTKDMLVLALTAAEWWVMQRAENTDGTQWVDVTTHHAAHQ